MDKTIRVLLVDDQEIVRQGLQRMLEVEEDIEIVGECASAEEAFSNMAKLQPDIVLMDAQMPGMGGVKATWHLKQNGVGYDGDVIVLAESAEYHTEALEAGAASYLLKDITGNELAQAIREVYWNSQLPDDHNNFNEEAIELIIPPSTNSSLLLSFIYLLEKRLCDPFTHVSIMHIIGSWDWGTIITLSLSSNQSVNLLEKLENLPEVERVEQKPLIRGTHPVLPKKFGTLPKPRISPNKIIHITLKETNISTQEFLSVSD